MSDFTPGPWVFEYEAGGVFNLRASDPERGLVICQRSIETPNRAEGTANARLIAAAPDLLAALHEARELIRGEYNDESLASGYWPTIKQIVDRLDAALAKAEGR